MTRFSFSENSFPPEELKFKIVKDVITFEAVILSYDFDGDGQPEGQSTSTTIIYDIGTTENPEIKKYLDVGDFVGDALLFAYWVVESDSIERNPECLCGLNIVAKEEN